jgi:hypothetical protein
MSANDFCFSAVTAVTTVTWEVPMPNPSTLCRLEHVQHNGHTIHIARPEDSPEPFPLPPPEPVCHRPTNPVEVVLRVGAEDWPSVLRHLAYLNELAQGFRLGESANVSGAGVGYQFSLEVREGRGA